MKSFSVRAITEGAIFASITAITAILIIYVPFLIVLAYLWPAPLVIVSYRNGLRVGIISAVVSALIIATFASPWEGLMLTINFGLPGLAMGYCLNKKMNPHLVIGITALALAVVMAVTMIASMLMLTPALFGSLNDIDEIFNETIETAEKTYRAIGMKEEDIEAQINDARQIVKLAKLILPSSFIISFIILAFANFKFVRFILKRTGHSIADTKSFSEWRFPDYISKPMLIILLIAVVLKLLKIELPYGIIDNVYIIISTIYMILGVSILTSFANHYSHKYEIPKALKIVFIFIVFLLFRQMLITVGMVDGVINLRAWLKRSGEV